MEPRRLKRKLVVRSSFKLATVLMAVLAALIAWSSDTLSHTSNYSPGFSGILWQPPGAPQGFPLAPSTWQGSRRTCEAVAMRAWVDPRKLTTSIRKAKDAQEVLDIAEAEMTRLNKDTGSPVITNQIHLTTVFARLAQIQHSVDRGVSQSAVLGKLVDHVQARLAAHGMDEQGSANILWAVATLQNKVPTLLRLVSPLTKNVKIIAHGLTAQGLSNIMWASAKGCWNATDLQDMLPVLANRAVDVAGDFNAQDVANTIWDIGLLIRREPSWTYLVDIIPDLTMAAWEQLDTFKPQDYSNLCWGLALCEWEDEAFLGLLADAVNKQASRWRREAVSMNLPQIACALAKLGVANKPLTRTIAELYTKGIVGTLNDWNLCALTWTYTEVFPEADLIDFQQRLKAEVRSRGISENEVKRSQLGPDVWRRE